MKFTMKRAVLNAATGFALTIAAMTWPHPGFTATAPAGQKSVKVYTSEWAAGERKEAQRGAAEAKQRVADAKKAIAKAESALSLSREYKDTEAEPIAQQALDTAQKALALAERHLQVQNQRVDTLGSMLKGISRGEKSAMALPLDMSGDVRLGAGSTSVPLDPTHVVLPGEVISTGPNGHVTLSLLSGEQVTLGPNTIHILHRVKMGKIEKFIYELKYGRERVLRKGLGGVQGSINDEHHYKAVAAVAAVRGTDFEMTVGADGLGHLALYDGRVMLSADAEEKPREKLKAWWLTEGVPAYAAPAEGSVSRIAAMSGAASIVSKDKSSRPAKAGDLLAAGERLETGPDAIAHLDLVRGQRVALGGGARLTGLFDSKGAPMYGVGRGVAHVWGADDKEPSQFLSPNAVTESRAKEFEVSVDASGAAEYTPLEGSLDISAVGDKLDWSKIDAWWDK